MKLMLMTALLACLSLNAAAQEVPDTIRDVPSGNAAEGDPEVKYHPEYKQLLDELKLAEEQLKGADEKSAASLRQRFDAVAARLNEYLASGKPTILSVVEAPGKTTPLPEDPSEDASLPKAESQGSGGPRRTTVPECTVSLDCYEQIDSEGLVMTAVKSVDADSGAYALEWQDNTFSVQWSETVVSDLITGGWQMNSVSISGRLSAEGERLETITFERREVNPTGSGGPAILDGRRITLVDVPLKQVKQAGMFELYEFELRGATALRPHVQKYTAISDEGSTTGMLRLDVPTTEGVIMGLRREPRIYVKVMKSML